jgi:hypothetical protein
MQGQRYFTPGSFVPLPSRTAVQVNEGSQRNQNQSNSFAGFSDPASSLRNNFVQIPTEMSPRRSMWVHDYSEEIGSDQPAGSVSLQHLLLSEHSKPTRLSRERSRRSSVGPAGVFVYDFREIHQEEIAAAAQRRAEARRLEKELSRAAEKCASPRSLAQSSKSAVVPQAVANSVWIRLQQQASVVSPGNSVFPAPDSSTINEGDTMRLDDSGDEAVTRRRMENARNGEHESFSMEMFPREDATAALRHGIALHSNPEQTSAFMTPNSLDSSSDTLGAFAEATPWFLNPQKEIPFTLLLMRGLTVEKHRDVFDHHLPPSFLQECSILQRGAYLTTFPSSLSADVIAAGFVAHERYFYLAMMSTKRYPQPMLCCKQYEGSNSLIDRIPLASLVDVTFDAFSSANFDNFHAQRTPAGPVIVNGDDFRKQYDMMVKKKWRQRRKDAKSTPPPNGGKASGPIHHRRFSSFGSAISVDGSQGGKAMQSIFGAFRSPGKWLREKAAGRRLEHQRGKLRKGGVGVGDFRNLQPPKPEDSDESDDSVTSNESVLDDIREEIMPALTDMFPLLIGSKGATNTQRVLPVQCAFTLWFYNPSSGSRQSVDLCAPSYRMATMWVRVMRGFVAINSVTTTGAVNAPGHPYGNSDTSANLAAAADTPGSAMKPTTGESPDKIGERSRLARSSIQRQRRREQPSFFQTFQE